MFAEPASGMTKVADEAVGPRATRPMGSHIHNVGLFISHSLAHSLTRPTIHSFINFKKKARKAKLILWLIKCNLVAVLLFWLLLWLLLWKSVPLQATCNRLLWCKCLWLYAAAAFFFIALPTAIYFFG